MMHKLFPLYEAIYRVNGGIRRELFRMLPINFLVNLRAKALEGGRTYPCTLEGVGPA